MAIQVVGRVINGTSGYDNFVGNEWSDTYRMTVNHGVKDMVDGGKGTVDLTISARLRAWTNTRPLPRKHI